MFVGANERSGTCRSAFQGRNNIAVECPYMQFCSARCPRLATTYIDSGLQYRSDCGFIITASTVHGQDLFGYKATTWLRKGPRDKGEVQRADPHPRILERNTRWGWELLAIR